MQRDCGTPELAAFVWDAERFLTENEECMRRFPGHVYALLIFSPKCCIVRQHFRLQGTGWIPRLPQTPHNWSPGSQKLESSYYSEVPVAWLSDGQVLAAYELTGNIWDQECRFWDMSTAANIRTLELLDSGPQPFTLLAGDNTLVTTAPGVVPVRDQSSGAHLRSFQLSDLLDDSTTSFSLEGRLLGDSIKWHGKDLELTYRRSR